jgi:pteridine reductase
MRRFWTIHVESPLLLSRAFFPMPQSAGGSIINMVDLQAERPIPGYLAYCASKAGLWNLTLGLAREMAPRVRVNGIAPGVVEWPADLSEAKREQYLRRVPLGRAGTPEDVAGAVAFLCTGAEYVTGQILRLDGGRSIV